MVREATASRISPVSVGTGDGSSGQAGPQASIPPDASPGSSSGAPLSPGTDGPSVRFDDRRLSLGDGVVGLGAGIEIWAVPAVTIAVPGLLVVLWVALQAVGAIAWIPAARRFRHSAEPKARSR